MKQSWKGSNTWESCCEVSHAIPKLMLEVLWTLTTSAIKVFVEEFVYDSTKNISLDIHLLRVVLENDRSRVI